MKLLLLVEEGWRAEWVERRAERRGRWVFCGRGGVDQVGKRSIVIIATEGMNGHGREHTFHSSTASTLASINSLSCLASNALLLVQLSASIAYSPKHPSHPI